MDQNMKVGAEILVNVILDRSGSMGSVRAQTIAGYNEFLKGLRSDAATKYSISLTQFDMVAAEPGLTVSYLDKPLAEVLDMTEVDYVPRGSTPLYDAIGETVRRTEADTKGRPVLTLIMTDGEENASIEFTKDSIKELIKRKESEGWTFTFIGANIDSFAVGGKIGVASHNVANYASAHVGTTFSVAADALMTRSANIRDHGLMAANAMPMYNDLQKSAMMGGNPSVRPPAPNAAPTKRTPPPAGPAKPRNWKASDGQ